MKRKLTFGFILCISLIIFSCSTEKKEGCMDPLAVNYDQTAEVIGNCIYNYGGKENAQLIISSFQTIQELGETISVCIDGQWEGVITGNDDLKDACDDVQSAGDFFSMNLPAGSHEIVTSFVKTEVGGGQLQDSTVTKFCSVYLEQQECKTIFFEDLTVSTGELTCAIDGTKNVALPSVSDCGIGTRYGDLVIWTESKELGLVVLGIPGGAEKELNSWLQDEPDCEEENNVAKWKDLKFGRYDVFMSSFANGQNQILKIDIESECTVYELR